MYLLQIDYYNKDNSGKKYIYKEFETFLELVSYFYGEKVANYGRYKIFQEKVLNVSLEDVED